ncbi:MAG: GvpL/GvpF family gas vesicle protein [Bacteroidota bacterium]
MTRPVRVDRLPDIERSPATPASRLHSQALSGVDMYPDRSIDQAALVDDVLSLLRHRLQPLLMEGFLQAALAHVQAEAVPPSSPSEAPALQGDGAAAMGLYVLGLVPRGAHLVLPASGMEPGHPVTTKAYRGLEAVVCPVTLEAFGPDAQPAQTNDLTWLEAMAQRHQRLQEEVRREGTTLLPMRFGTICHDEPGLLTFLEAHHDDFLHTLSALRGMQEWGLKVFCDDTRFNEHVELAPDVPSPDGASEGTAYFLRKKHAQARAQAYAQRLALCLDEIDHTLQAHAQEAVRNEPQEPRWSGHTLPNVLNAAYLVGRDDEPAFLQAVDRLVATYAPLGLEVVRTGPWPPYHFARLDADSSTDIVPPSA